MRAAGVSVTRTSMVEPGRGEADLEPTRQAVEMAHPLGVGTLEPGPPRLDERSAGI